MKATVFYAVMMIPLSSAAALCQVQPPSPSQTPSPAMKSEATGGKRSQCLQSVLQKGFRGMERADAMELCMAEARLDCVKDEINKKMPVKDRKAGLKACIGE